VDIVSHGGSETHSRMRITAVLVWDAGKKAGVRIWPETLKE
jgi:hypothetical protein